MRKFTYLIGAVLLTGSVNAQLFSDDFESYTTGALGPQSTDWTTWDGTEGGTEDGIVSTAQASSGTKSVYFTSLTTGGGPQDCVLKFGSNYTSGIFTFQSDFYIVSGKSGYFNLQSSQTLGTAWALNVYFDNGTLSVDDGVTADLVNTAYPEASWFTLTIQANLTTGIWEAFVDGTQVGIWENSVNSLGAVDFFPLNGDRFYIDDVSFDHQAYTASTLNAAISGINIGGTIATQTVTPKVKVNNAGSTAITSFDVALNYNGSVVTQSFTGQNLTASNSYEVSFSPISLAAGTNTVQAYVYNVNGGTDDNQTDDTASVISNPIVPALGKMVVGEEATGTWCQWCPRGAVYMDMFQEKYDEFWAGIAVHNDDPMTVTAYDDGVGTLISGYPSALVDREDAVDPSGMSPDFFTRLQTAPVAFITNGATWDSVTRQLNVAVTADFQSAANSNYKIACVLTEDHVTGTGSGYNQSNAYAGGNNGVMGGFESLPNPVPAAQMVYNHVARTIQPSFTGYANSFPATVSAGESYTLNFQFTLPATWDETQINIIGMLIDPNGQIDNAGKATIDEAVANGYSTGTEVAGIEELLAQPDALFKVYPNPVSGQNAYVGIQLDGSANVQLRLLDVSGKELAARNYGTINGASTVELNTSTLKAGVYMVELTVDGHKLMKQLVVQ